jgi:cysteine desulfurase/selenocysteine lyase
MTYPIDNIKKDFSMIGQTVGEKTLCYLDSTATTLKPNSVIEVMNQFYSNEYSSVKRGVYKLSEATTQKFERVRGLIQNFIGAKQEEEIIFTRGTTESINLVASTWGRKNISKGDVIILSALEHHANIVPWQMLAEEKEAVIKVIPADDKGNLIVEEFDKYVAEGFKFLSIGHIANSIGTVNDVEYFCNKAKEIGATVLIDAAQSIAHATLNVQELNCDFLAFSGHKLYGPTGIGVLYGKYELLEIMPPYHGGGEMIDKVTFAKTTYAKPPARFEAGTPAIAEVIGLGAAIDYVLSIGLEQIAKYEHDLLEYLKEQLLTIEGIQFVGEAKNQAGIQSFILPYAHAFDIGMILDEEGVAIRTGHHCAQPVMDHFGVSATVRASIGIYNDKADIDILIKGLKRVEKIFA